jgi:hypothetical protein
MPLFLTLTSPVSNFEQQSIPMMRGVSASLGAIGLLIAKPT